MSGVWLAHAGGSSHSICTPNTCAHTQVCNFPLGPEKTDPCLSAASGSWRSLQTMLPSLGNETLHCYPQEKVVPTPTGGISGSGQRSGLPESGYPFPSLNLQVPLWRFLLGFFLCRSFLVKFFYWSRIHYTGGHSMGTLPTQPPQCECFSQADRSTSATSILQAQQPPLQAQMQRR